MKQIFTAKTYIEQYKACGWRRIQVQKLIYTSRFLFHLGLENIVVVVCTDAKWPSRRNRTPLERLAVKIGHSVYLKGNQERQYIVWAYPTDSVPFSRYEGQKVLASLSGHKRQPPPRQTKRSAQQ